ncbi:glycosyl hydrolase family 95 catalytic domain-containing protein [Paenibacillus sp. N3.4]|uniref:glycosyl hydrolase family 95 catalytic domain-containing protein n=1 Tax=Paenibacillus sp. N3.4 TaxID=2603222 RepID=UPI0011CA31A5|nr:hypothetical protein [Paenibacillus sp. N3.4]TXK84283.1 hypothetical protein FU659_09530 [Paenibacillus sp. N3.4]
MHDMETARMVLNVEWERFMAENDMEWVVKPVSWDEGAFIGNGSIGSMIYGEENAKKRHVLRFVAGRTDVTASRTDRPGFPPRVPIGELDLEMEGMIYHPTSMRVDLWNAELRANLTTTRGEVNLRSIVHSEVPVMAVEIETSEGENGTQFSWYPYPEVDHVLKNADGFNLNQFIPATEVEKADKDGVSFCIQRYSSEEGCVTAWREIQTSPNCRVFFMTIIKGHDEAAMIEAVDAVNQASNMDFDEWVRAHRQWWHRYYRKSFVSIPDGRLQSFYWIQMYKLASATRADQLLIDNQGPWLTSTPWPGVWFNMNVQMSYSPVYTANRLDIGASLVRTLEENKENLINNVPEPFRHDSAGLGRSCSYDLRAEVDDEIGNLNWICHNVWRQYRYSMDDEMLKTILFPLLRRSVNYYLHILEEGDDGWLHLPPTISPEYGSFMRTKVRDCHYDLALLRWGCETLLEICDRLTEEDPLRVKWKEVLEKLTPLPVDETGFMIGQDTPLAYGHRHFSHLLAIFPLHLIGCEREEDRELIATSLRHWIGKEGDLRGFSMTGAASIAATLGWGNEALRYLQSLLMIIKPNTMYKEAGPVIETPLAGAEAIHDMLLQSWGGKIRVFPAVPDEWRETAFHDLRTEGAFLVSAMRRDGETQFIRVKSLAGEPCVIKTGWNGIVGWKIMRTNVIEHTVDLKDGEDEIILDLGKGEEAILYPGEEVPDLKIHAVESHRKVARFFGGHKPWRLYGL